MRPATLMAPGLMLVRDIRPANTAMQVTRFIVSEWLVELEVDACIDDQEEQRP